MEKVFSQNSSLPAVKKKSARTFWREEFRRPTAWYSREGSCKNFTIETKDFFTSGVCCKTPNEYI